MTNEQKSDKPLRFTLSENKSENNERIHHAIERLDGLIQHVFDLCATFRNPKKPMLDTQPSKTRKHK